MCNNSCSVDTYSGSSFDSGSLQRVLPSHRWSSPIPTDQTHFFHLHKKKSITMVTWKHRFSAWSMSLKCYNSFVILAYPDIKLQRSSNIHSLRFAPQSEGSSTSHSETRWPITTPSGISNAIKTWKKCPASVFCSLAGCCTVTAIHRFGVHWLVVVPLNVTGTFWKDLWAFVSIIDVAKVLRVINSAQRVPHYLYCSKRYQFVYVASHFN